MTKISKQYYLNRKPYIIAYILSCMIDITSSIIVIDGIVFHEKNPFLEALIPNQPLFFSAVYGIFMFLFINGMEFIYNKGYISNIIYAGIFVFFISYTFFLAMNNLIIAKLI